MPLKIFCDSCGEEIKQGALLSRFISSEKVSVFNPQQKAIESEFKQVDYYLCKKCADKIIQMIKKEK